MTVTLEGVCHIDVLCSLVRQSLFNIVADIRLIEINVNYGPKIMMNSANAISTTVEPLLYDHPQNHIGVVV